MADGVTAGQSFDLANQQVAKGVPRLLQCRRSWERALPPQVHEFTRKSRALGANTALERPVPQNVDVERAVLGAILLDNFQLDVAVAKVKPEDFFHDGHRRILRLMLAMRGEGVAIDLVTLKEWLQRVGELENVGGAAYVASLIDGVPKVSNVEHYCRIVKEKSIMRAVIHAAAAIQQRAHHGHEDPDTVLRAANELYARMVSANQLTNGITPYTPRELADIVSEPVEYVVFPFAAKGMVALIDGAAKSAGKTTLIVTAVAAVCHGQLFLNRATKSAPILVLTEENPRTFRLALERAGLADDAENLYIVPYTGRPWAEVTVQAERICTERKIAWLIADTFFALAQLGGDAENDAGAVDSAFAPVRRMAGSLDLAVTLTRHSRKAGGSVGESGRGSTALTGAADIICELKRLPGNRHPERRQLEIAGRIEQRRLEIELRDGRYVVCETSADRGDEAETIAKAIGANPTASMRQLQRVTGVGRNRILNLASKTGWLYGHGGWKRSTQGRDS